MRPSTTEFDETKQGNQRVNQFLMRSDNGEYHITCIFLELIFTSILLSELTATWSVKDIHISKPTTTQQQPTTPKISMSTSKDNYYVNIPAANWVIFIDEVARRTMKRIVRHWKKVNSSSLPVHPSLPDRPKSNTQSSIKNSACFTVGGKVEVVLGSEVRRGVLQPVVRGIQVCPTFLSCVSHQRDPEQVFASPVVSCTEFVYQDIQHYQRVVLPLIEAEAAVCSVKHAKSHVQLCGVSLAWRVALQSGELYTLTLYLYEKGFVFNHS